MTHYAIDGLRYHVEEAGVGEPLILLHGFTGSTMNWCHPVVEFSKRFHVIAVDLPGHGRSDTPDGISRYEMAHVAADLAQLSELLGVVPAHWLGYSMGGRLALYITIHFPRAVRSVILESSSPGIADPVQRDARRTRDGALAERIEIDGIQAFVDQWEQIPLFETQMSLPLELRTALRNQRLGNSARGLSNSLRGMGTGMQPSLWDQLGSKLCPMLLLVGSRDDKFVAINRKMAAEIPGAQLKIIPDAGHTVHLEQPRLFSEAVMDFLSQFSDDRGQHLPEAEQSDENQRRQ